MEKSSFLISDSIRQVVEYHHAGDKESALNFASLVVWRINQYGSWLTDSEITLIDKCLKFKPRRRKSL